LMPPPSKANAPKNSPIDQIKVSSSRSAFIPRSPIVKAKRSPP
jgi:hypothetical protein